MRQTQILNPVVRDQNPRLTLNVVQRRTHAVLAGQRCVDRFMAELTYQSIPGIHKLPDLERDVLN